MPAISSRRVGHAFRSGGTLRITGSGYFWVQTPTEAFGQLYYAYTDAILRGIMAIANRRAPEIENWMKENAPWTDRTGNARQTLFTEVQQVTDKMVHIIVSHGVHYGLFLEVKNAGKYAIVNPAIDHWGPIIWGDVRQMLGQ